MEGCQALQKAVKPWLLTQVGQLISEIYQEQQPQHPHRPARGVVGDCQFQGFEAN